MSPASLAPKLRLPDFVIGGAPRSATTWLCEVLCRHPEIRLAQPVKPEPKFFLVDDVYSKGLEHYSAKWFSNMPADVAAGEKSTNYLESATAAERMAKDIPNLKLIFLLRDPVERAVSNFHWSTMNGQETKSFADALALEDAREAGCPPQLRYARPHALYSRGLYAKLLEAYLARFPAKQIFCFAQEEMLASPGEQIARLHEFLGVERRPADATGVGVVNPSDKSGQDEIPSSVKAALRERYRAPNAELDRLLGRPISRWWSDNS